MIPEQIEVLSEKLLNGSISAEELEELNNWYASHQDDELILDDRYTSTGDLKNRITAGLKNKIEWDNNQKARRITRVRWLAAASIAAILAGIYLVNTTFRKTADTLQHQAQPVAVTSDIGPGENKAILTLGDGTKINLDNAHTGVVAQEGKTSITKLANGQIYYDASGKTNSVITSNTMTTPRGGQYKLRLPDGTMVWLNAASYITYPTAFTGVERIVKISGEIYFEVAKNPSKPFKVILPDASEIEVLGTHFNVNAYSDEININTTLVEGSVRVTSANSSMQLQPGQCAQLDRKGKMKMIRNANIERAIGWKEGVFNFQYEKLESVMRQIARWYDVNIVYEKGVPDIELYGKMGRDLQLSQVLQVLTDMEVKYKIENERRLIILPK